MLRKKGEQEVYQGIERAKWNNTQKKRALRINPGRFERK
jgi:hypothetical protein